MMSGVCRAAGRAYFPSSQRESAGSSTRFYRPPLLPAWMGRLVPPRPPGTREELKERVLAKYGATNITDDDLAALMALKPELDMLFSRIRSFTNMSDGLRLTFAMRIGTQRTIVIVCATRLLRHRIKESHDEPVAKRLLDRHGFMASVIVHESIRNLHGPHKIHASLDPGPEAWGMSKLPDEVTNRFTRTGLGTKSATGYRRHNWRHSIDGRKALWTHDGS